MNVVVWARVSSREQKEGYSIDAQLRAMHDKATKHGWKIVREFVIAESARRGADRRVFNEMLRWIKKNAKREKIDAIFAHKLDRVCRNMRDAVRLQELEDEHGVKLVFVENDFGPGAAGALSFNVMAAVGHVYRRSRPRFHRTALSGILSNRFYIGELHRGGNVYRGRYRLLIDRATFDACQDILQGRNRRVSRPNLQYAGGLLHCEHCGFAITGERIRRKQRDGSIREHFYYRCGNNDPPDGHPTVRWREPDLESAIIEHLEAFKFPSEESADWFRDTLKAVFDDREQVERERRRALNKRRNELAGMQERLLNTHLVGAIDEATFTAKSTDLKHQQADVERLDLNRVEMTLKAFDFSQNLVEIWRGSNSARRRELLDCVSLNCTLSEVSLYIARRKPFDFFAERPFLRNSRGDWIRTSDLCVPNTEPPHSHRRIPDHTDDQETSHHHHRLHPRRTRTRTGRAGRNGRRLGPGCPRRRGVDRPRR